MGVIKKWKVVDSRPYRWGRNRMMKPNQIFFATEEEIPKDFKPMIIELESTPTSVKINRVVPISVPEPLEIPPVVQKSITYRLRVRGDYFDVVDIKGKKVNEQNLSEEEATALLKKLEA